MKNLEINRRNAIALGMAAPFAFTSPLIAGERPNSYGMIGKPAPKFNLKKNGGGSFSNASFKGKTTIVEFFGLWCPDCMADAENVALLAESSKLVKDINFIAIHTKGSYGRWGSIDKFFAEKGYKYPVAIDDDMAAYKAFGMAWVPSFLVIDKKGIIRDFTTDLGAGGIGAKGLLTKAIAVSKLK